MEPINLSFTVPADFVINSAVLQMFVDDFQAPVWGTKYQVKLNEREIPEIEEILNSLDQTGPIGKLVTIQIPGDNLDLLKKGSLSINIDDPVTGAGDGYAIDFVKLLINFKQLAYLGNVTGVVVDGSTNPPQPLAGVTVSAGGLSEATTDGSGSYTLTGVPAGLTAVKAQKDGYESQVKTVDVVADTTQPLDLSLGKQPEIIVQPSDVTGCEGASAVFRVTASGTEPIEYQWMKDGSPIDGAISAKYTIAPVSPSDAGNYTVEVSDSLGGTVISREAILTVNSPPEILTQPSDVTCSLGESASFKVKASGTEPLTYQWKKDGSYIIGANGDTYTIFNVSSSDAGTYTVEVSDTYCRVTSSKAALILKAVPSSHYDSMESFETLLGDQQTLLVSFDDLMGQTPVTREQKIEFLNSIEDLYRRQALGMDKFSIWINENWAGLTPDEKANVAASLEDLLRRQADNLEAYNGNLLAWVKTFGQPYRQKFSDSFEDLLHRQVALLKNFESVLNQGGMQTPQFLASCEDLLRRQAQSLEGFGDLGEFTFNDTSSQEGPGIAIYKTADKTSLECGDNVTYKYTVYNNGDENVTDIEVTDPNLPDGQPVDTIQMLGVYQSRSIEKTVTYGCSRDVTYPIKVCDNATAIGTASVEKVEATSNDVCIILNGPQAEASCGQNGKAVTVSGPISKDENGCIILTANNGIVYNLRTDDDTSEAWQEVKTILETGGCAKISGCANFGLKTACSQGMPLYVESCGKAYCASPIQKSIPNKSVKPIASAKEQSNIELNEKNTSLTENQSGLEVHPNSCPICGKNHAGG